MALEQSVLDREYVKVKVTVSDDPTVDVVEFAFLSTDGDPVSGDWVTGEWQTVNGNYFARVLVGPGGTIELPIDGYWMWIRITDSPEIVVRRVGRLLICGEEGS